MRAITTPWKLGIAFTAITLSGAQAHTEVAGRSVGWSDLLIHPFTGSDHLALVLAIGIWAAWQGQRVGHRSLALFVGATVMGTAPGAITSPSAAIETGLTLSLVLLGVMLVRPTKPGFPATLLVIPPALLQGQIHGSHQMYQSLSLPGLGAVLLGTVAALSLSFGVGVVTREGRMRTLIRGCGAALALASGWALFAT